MLIQKASLILQVLFIQIFEHWAWMAEASRSHSWTTSIKPSLHTSLGLARNSSWTWKIPRTFPSSSVFAEHFKRGSVGRSSDWTWNQNSADTSPVSAKTLSFQVLSDKVQEHSQTKLPPADHIYDPYAFQHRHHFDYHPYQTQLYLPGHKHFDHAHQTFPSLQTHEWQNLRPWTYSQQNSYRPHENDRLQESRPPRTAILSSGPFRSISSTNSNAASAIDTTSSNIINHVSSHAQGSSPGEIHNHGHNFGQGWNAPRLYPHSHYYPVDYPRKRYRLEVHPGVIAAPIAGLAAFGVAHALKSKPVLFELGLVDKKKGFSNYAPHFHHSTHPVTPPYLPKPPNLSPHFGQHHHHPHHHLGQHHLHHSHHQHGHHHHPIDLKPAHHDVDPPHHGSLDTLQYPPEKPESNSKPWWSPFAAMIPRLKDDIERD